MSSQKIMIKFGLSAALENRDNEHKNVSDAKKRKNRVIRTLG
jgi:hypothetical protein